MFFLFPAAAVVCFQVVVVMCSRVFPYRCCCWLPFYLPFYVAFYWLVIVVVVVTIVVVVWWSVSLHMLRVQVRCVLLTSK